MSPVHSLLKRQIKKCFGQSATCPTEMQGFVDAVNEAYWQSDADRGTLERSLELSSQELLTANSEIRAFFQAFPDQYFRLDDEGTILEVKADTEANLYIPSSELLGKRIQAIPEKSLAEEFARAIDRFRQTRSLVSFEYSLKLTGERKHFEVRLVPLLDKQILAIVRDITKRKQVEEALHEGVQFRTMLDQVVDYAIVMLDAEGCVATWNAGAERINGYVVTEILGRHSSCFYTQEDIAAAKPESLLRRAQSEGNVVDETWRVRKDGSRFWARVALTTIRDEHGQLRGFSQVTHDMTDSRQLQEQLRQAQKMEAVGQLAGGVAHDFNNLLTVISGHCELLMRQIKTGGVSQESIEEIQNAAQRAAALTRQLLAFSSKQVLQPKVLDLNDVCAGMEKMARRLIGEHIELRTVFKRPLGRISADPGQIEQVILNLVVNARDAMPRGGRLLIETSNVTLDQKSHFKDRELQPGEYVMLAITDTGIGMTDSVKAHLFEPFFTTKGPGKGTGLGLATCFGIVRQSGGDIRVYSEPDRGTTFRIYFPRTGHSAATEAPPAESAPPCNGTETLLLIEDDVSVRCLTASVLRSCGFIVHEAADGMEGIQVISGDHSPKFDLIVSDIIMPRMGGKEMVENVRLRHPDIKVLFISGYTDDALADRGALGPGIAFMEKPFSPKRLVQRVREILDEPSALVELAT